jgi:hypothetical protein
MTKKIASTARIRRTTVLAARLWVVLALAVAVTTLASCLRVGTDEAAARNGAPRRKGTVRTTGDPRESPSCALNCISAPRSRGRT